MATLDYTIPGRLTAAPARRTLAAMAAIDLFASLGGDLAREFAGRQDTLPRALIWDEEAPRLLAEAASPLVAGRRATVLCDDRTVEAGGRDLLRAFAARGWSVEELRVPDGPSGSTPVCDDRTRDALAARLPAADLLLAAGSGVVNDLCKWLAAGAGLPYAVLATAATTNYLTLPPAFWNGLAAGSLDLAGRTYT